MPRWEAMSDADRDCRAVIAAIRSTAAEGLSASRSRSWRNLPHDDDPEDVVDSLDGCSRTSPASTDRVQAS